MGRGGAGDLRSVGMAGVAGQMGGTGLDRAGKKIARRACVVCVRACWAGRGFIGDALGWCRLIGVGSFLALRGSWGADTAWGVGSRAVHLSESRIDSRDAYRRSRESLSCPPHGT
jgi:hypothetical protein